MTLKVQFSPGVEDRVGFAVSPICEAFLSLHVLREPEHHPLNHPYVRRMRDWPAELRRELARFAFAFQNAPMALGLPLAGADQPSFADELAVMRQATNAQAMAFFARTHYLSTVLPSPDSRSVQETTFRYFCTKPPPRVSLALTEQAVHQPRRTLLAFADVLEHYWHAVFEEEWQRTLPKVEAAIIEARLALARGIEPFLRPLWPEVRLDEKRRTFFSKRIHDHNVTIGPSERLRLMPSIFAWPHVRMYCDQPGEVLVAYPPLSVITPDSPARPPSDLLDLLAALSNDTRLRTLYYLHQRPRSAQELAPLVGVRASTLSDHLRKLQAAGIVCSSREGYYVLYEVGSDLGDLISHMLDGYLSTPDGRRPEPQTQRLRGS